MFEFINKYFDSIKAWREDVRFQKRYHFSRAEFAQLVCDKPQDQTEVENLPLANCWDTPERRGIYVVPVNPKTESILASLTLRGPAPATNRGFFGSIAFVGNLHSAMREGEAAKLTDRMYVYVFEDGYNHKVVVSTKLDRAAFGSTDDYLEFRHTVNAMSTIMYTSDFFSSITAD